jgi:hypothetical protein
LAAKFRHSHGNTCSTTIFHYHLCCPQKYLNLPYIPTLSFYYKRFIDYIVSTGLSLPYNTWEEFKNTQNGFGELTWNIKVLGYHTTFLDLNMQIHNQKLHFNTFQKELNLYLYMPLISPFL